VRAWGLHEHAYALSYSVVVVVVVVGHVCSVFLRRRGCENI
jgi:hypothetical protein